MSTPYMCRLASDEIRLLTLSQGNERLLEIRREAFKITSAPSFQALSYTWHPPLYTDPKCYEEEDFLLVLLDGHPHRITPNLHDALTTIRARHLAQYLWVDALCINQADLEERAAQVSKMDRIYSNAERVIVWLGREGEHAKEVKSILAIFAQHYDEDGDAGYEVSVSHADGIHDQHLMERLGLGQFTDIHWRALMSFWERNWFRRQWVIQEVCLAQRILVLWGPDELPWASLTKASNYQWNSRLMYSMLRKYWSNTPEEPRASRGRSVLTMECIQVALQASAFDDSPSRIDVRTLLEPMRLLGARDTEFSAADMFIFLCQACSYFEATDARDKVFALLGLLHKIADLNSWSQLQISPSFAPSNSAASTFTSAFATVAPNLHTMDWLGLVIDKTQRTTASLPSWVPDLAAGGSLPLCFLPRGSGLPYKASAEDAEKRCEIDVDAGQLGVQTKIAGAVEYVAGEWLGLVDVQVTQLARLLLQMPEVCPHTGIHRLEVLWHTLLLSNSVTDQPIGLDPSSTLHDLLLLVVLNHFFRAMKGDPIMQEFRSSIQERLDSMQPIWDLATGEGRQFIPNREEIDFMLRKIGYIDDPKLTDLPAATQLLRDLEKNAAPFQHILDIAASFRRFVTTGNQYLSIVPMSTQVGDVIAIIRGASVPFVLRPLASREGYFELIGEAYVHGIMNGQLVDDTTVWKDIELV